MNYVKTTTEISRRRLKTKIRTSAGSAGSGRTAQKPSIRARGRRGESLGSARDRQKLRERNTAERARVEGMFANVAAPIERRIRHREFATGEQSLHRRQPGLRAVQPAGCPVCGDDRIVTDEVMCGGTLRMSECLHCDHRWTERPKGHWVELGARMNRDRRPRALQVVER